MWERDNTGFTDVVVPVWERDNTGFTDVVVSEGETTRDSQM